MSKYLTSYMAFIAIFGSFYLYIQAYQILATKEAEGVSILAYIVVLIAASSWFIYSFYTNNLISRLSATLGIIGAILVIFLAFKYRDNEPESKPKFTLINRKPDEIIYAYEDDEEDRCPWYFVRKTCPISIKRTFKNRKSHDDSYSYYEDV